MNRQEDEKSPVLNRTPKKHGIGKYMMVLYMKPEDCGGRCLYCFSNEGLTKSTTENEDTALARSLNWSALEQFCFRERAYGLARGAGNKYELRIKGDSFANHDRGYIERFIWDIFDELNGVKSPTFAAAYQLQREAPDRCVSVVVETRPDQIDEEFCRFMAEHGISTVEIGVQSLDDDVLRINRRGHGVQTVVSCTKLLRDWGFEVGYHMMAGMVGSSYEKDCETFARGLWQDCFFPDSLKIYPCTILKNTDAQKDLYDCYRRGWEPLTDGQYLNMMEETAPHFPRSVHVNRIQRCFRADEILGGPSGDIDRSRFDGVSQCLWQRSVQNRGIDLEGDFTDFRVVAEPQGEDLCIQALFREDIVLGYLRLHRKGDAAVIRDVRTLGEPKSIFDHNDERIGVQHIGIGKQMVKRAEHEAALRGAACIQVRPSPGAHGYFEKLGYDLEPGALALRKPLCPPEGAGRL